MKFNCEVCTTPLDDPEHHNRLPCDKCGKVTCDDCAMNIEGRIVCQLCDRATSIVVPQITMGLPETFEKFPLRTELTILPADEPRAKKIGWTCYQVQGTEVYRPPQGVMWPITTVDEANVIAVDANLILDEKGLRDGEELLIQDLFGWCIGVISFDSMGVHQCVSKSGSTLFLLKFADDRPDRADGTPAPPRWVCLGSANLKGIRKMSIDTEVGSNTTPDP